MTRHDRLLAELTEMLADIQDEDDFFARLDDGRHEAYCAWLGKLSTRALATERDAAARDDQSWRRRVRTIACSWEYRFRENRDRAALDAWNRAVQP